jgi:hypothetical protein
MTSEGKREAADQPAAGRLDRGSRQGATEVRLTEPGHPEPGGHGVIAQPAERKLIRNRERDQGVRGTMPVIDDAWIADSEVKCRVYELTSLRCRPQIAPGDQVQASRRMSLAMRHGPNNSTDHPIVPRCA